MLKSETREHVPSYYAATANWQTNYPKLEGNITADVCVIGGGFSGVVTTLNLAEKGFNVVLIEANRIAWGASGRNGGHVNGSIGRDPHRFINDIGEDGVRAIQKMGPESADIIRKVVEKYKIDCDLTWGYCYAGTKPRHIDLLHEMKADMESFDFPAPISILNKDETYALVNNERYIGSLITNGWGHVHSLNLCIGEARAAENLGARIFEQTRAIKITHATKPIVHTEHGQIQANFVVLCGEAYMQNLMPSLEKYITPHIDYIIVTEPLEGDRLVIKKKQAAADMRNFLNYYRLTKDNRLLFGGGGTIFNGEPADVVARMRKELEYNFPQLKNIRIDYTWRGQMGISMNLMPQLGCINNNVYYVQGYTGDGVAPTHLMGKLLSDVINGQTTAFDILAKIKHRPFLGNLAMRKGMLSMGKIYYRLLDIL